MNEEDKFFSKVRFAEDSDCWNWIGGKYRDNYGRFCKPAESGASTVVRAHRWSYNFFNGTIPKGMFICHTCDHPPCVKPAHLFAGTQSDNIQDCVNKGRHFAASRTHCKRGHKFTKENTYIKKTASGRRRQCRTCRNIRLKEYRSKHKEKLNARQRELYTLKRAVK